jgi:DAACS family dicarboxylate/amino acid:cation (Na+ or H+) symporter
MRAVERTQFLGTSRKRRTARDFSAQGAGRDFRLPCGAGLVPTCGMDNAIADRLARRVLLGLGAGLALALAVRGIALVAPGVLEPANWVAQEVLAPFGSLFLRLLLLVVVPLVFASLALGVTSLAGQKRLAGLTGRTFLLFFVNMSVGVALGLLFMNVVEPGAGFPEELREQLRQDAQHSAQAAQLQQRAQAQAGGYDFAGLVALFAPQNLLGAVVGQSPERLGNLVALILAALLTGAAATRLAPGRRASFEEAMATVGELCTTVVGWAMRLAPYAVAALVCAVVLRFGWDYLRALSLFTVGTILVIALHLFGTLGLLVKFFGGRAPLEFFRAIRVVLATAFSTSSSNATLPSTIAVARERLGVSQPVAGFVLPLGATLNMSGSALYEGCVVLFLAQVYGVHLDLGQQLLLLLLAVASAVAVAGIPGGTLPFIVGLLATFKVPVEGIALILGVDRLLDMCRTTLNVAGDLATAVIVERSRGTPGDGVARAPE